MYVGCKRDAGDEAVYGQCKHDHPGHAHDEKPAAMQVGLGSGRYVAVCVWLTQVHLGVPRPPAQNARQKLKRKEAVSLLLFYST